VWYHALSLCYAHIRCSGIILISQATFVPNFVSVTTSIAELAHGEKLHTQSLTHPAYLMPQEPKRLHLEKSLMPTKTSTALHVSD